MKRYKIKAVEVWEYEVEVEVDGDLEGEALEDAIYEAAKDVCFESDTDYTEFEVIETEEME